jgi:5'-AMP-activated protein kinase regulatory beta subunit
MKTTRKLKQRKDGPVTSVSYKTRIEFHGEQALQVSLAGTFNDWRPDATPMLALGDVRWEKELMLPPGRYEYLFVVDGEWQSDPAAVEQTPNVYGGLNSVLNVPGSARGTKGPEP